MTDKSPENPPEVFVMDENALGILLDGVKRSNSAHAGKLNKKLDDLGADVGLRLGEVATNVGRALDAQNTHIEQRLGEFARSVEVNLEGQNRNITQELQSIRQAVGQVPLFRPMTQEQVERLLKRLDDDPPPAGST